MFHRTAPTTVRILRALTLLPLSMAALACASAGHLAQYDFLDRTVGVALLNAPRPELLTNKVLDLNLSNPLQAAAEKGTSGRGRRTEGPTHLFIQAEVILRDAPSGRRIWKGKVTEREAITPHLLGIPRSEPSLEGVARDVLTAAALATLSTQQMTPALEALGDFASDRILRQFRRGLERARG